MKAFNIYLTGVGGQGIGLISEIVLRAVDHSGQRVKSVDTHGLAQRGGIVVSQIRLGDLVHSPLIPAGRADLAISLERHEALRAAATALREGGCLVYYDTVWQPLTVRLGDAAAVTIRDIDHLCRKQGIRVIPVFHPDLPDIRMQNMVVLGAIAGNGLIPGVGLDHYRSAMGDLMSGTMLERNRALFDQRAGK
ncbi:indolepyruvate oxidoreductase [Desulfosarcina widdelii]|uniref:Indolepyruvate oxidoreductase n=1 Tax=Desulfosarcina widdelii TaxID=947919 RepID=A0A5K7Z0Z2_9BACT|nr:2-oxoacid:acceptor oxidoreductase family protein [Desulfosarcina widdelii]BBO73899.1 indolepyruvate oxidoreductase [Desulfosarcina widdelii]